MRVALRSGCFSKRHRAVAVAMEFGMELRTWSGCELVAGLRTVLEGLLRPQDAPVRLRPSRRGAPEPRVRDLVA